MTTPRGRDTRRSSSAPHGTGAARGRTSEKNADVLPIRGHGEPVKPSREPWTVLGFESEREMLLGELQVLDFRVKASGTAAHAVAALSKRKQEILEQIKRLDVAEDEDEDEDILANLPPDVPFDPYNSPDYIPGRASGSNE